jgi:hypothetical protein
MATSRAKLDRQRMRVQRSSLDRIRQRLDDLAAEAAELRARIAAFIQRNQQSTLPFRSSKYHHEKI